MNRITQSVILLLFCVQSALAFQPNPATQFDDRQPGIMTFLPMDLYEKYFHQATLEVPLIQETVFSFTQEKEVFAREQFIYSYNLGFNYHIHHFGTQISGSFVKLFPSQASLNYQIDFFDWNQVLFSLGTMYGGTGYGRERYGALLMASYRHGQFNFFSTVQYLKSRRHFYSANKMFNVVSGAPDNSLSYLLQTITPAIGIRYGDNEYLKSAIELNIGWETNEILDEYNVQIQPAKYKRSDGFVVSGSVILPIELLNRPNTIEDLEQ